MQIKAGTLAGARFYLSPDSVGAKSRYTTLFFSAADKLQVRQTKLQLINPVRICFHGNDSLECYLSGLRDNTIDNIVDAINAGLYNNLIF